jgi:hypothetical protein
MAVFKGHGEPIPLPELERYRDAEWALHDPAIQRTYQGQWVVAFERTIIAHGTDAQAVAAQARQIAQGQAHRLVFCAPEDPGEWVGHSPDTDVDFNDA